MTRCTAITKLHKRCKNVATTTRSSRCTLHRRSQRRVRFGFGEGCSSDVDPISQEPYPSDDIIRIQAGNGVVHCFDAPTFKTYIEYEIRAGRQIRNPLTRDIFTPEQLEPIMERLGLNIRPRKTIHELQDIVYNEGRGMDVAVESRLFPEVFEAVDRYFRRYLIIRVRMDLEEAMRLFNEGRVHRAFAIVKEKLMEIDNAGDDE